jgi:GxxExxY protein
MQTSSEKYDQWRAAMLPAVPMPWHVLMEAVIAAAEEVHAALGQGLSREAYAMALRHECGLRGLAVEGERAVRMRYKHVELPVQRLDAVVNGLVGVEVATGGAGDGDVSRLDALLRAADLPLGLAIDFSATQVRHGAFRRFNRIASASLALIGERSLSA